MFPPGYCRPGALIGAMSVFADEFAMPATTQALVDADLLRMQPSVVLRAAERDVRVARVFLVELSERTGTSCTRSPGAPSPPYAGAWRGICSTSLR
ncbi:MAG: hypothetical protein ACRDKW_10705, partial [Actinomycetota bacterium]